MSPGEMTGGRGTTSFAGELLPGGRKCRLLGDSGRGVAGVVGRDILEVGRTGGGMPSVLNRLDLLVMGAGQGDTVDRVSIVRSDNDGRGFGRSFVSLMASPLLGFSEASSNTGTSCFVPGGVVSKTAVCASRRASRTGDALLGFPDLSFHA